MDKDFKAAMSGVAPLDPKQRKKAQQLEVQLDSQKKLPHEVTPAQLERRDAALGVNRQPRVDPNQLTLAEVTQVAPRDVLQWKKDGVQHEVYAHLKSGRYPVEGSLDLHRLTVKESREAMYRFFQLAEARRWRTVLIAHGRGEQSSTPARIKSFVAHWLRQMPQINAFHSADRRHGGTGAVLVLLKKSAEAKEETREQFGMKSSPDLEDQ